MPISPEIQVIASIAIIIAATIAAAISFIGLVISKENKVSEFRQEWINNLRQELSDYLSNVQLLTHSILFARDFFDVEKKKEDIFETTSEYRMALNEKYCLIRLRLNPDEDSHRELLCAIQSLNEKITRKDKNSDWYTRDEINAATEAVLDKAQKILKFEWQRVKKGERWFFWTKYLVGSLVVLMLIASTGVFSQRISQRPQVETISPATPTPPKDITQGRLRKQQ